MNLVTVGDNGKTVIIRFDLKMKQDVSHMNDFDISKRRNLVNAADDIVETLNHLFDSSDELIFDYLQMK